mmetsp:Transcript_13397/g.31536  ORF Transcript_13397/g.31536 Transcript_13397/m.31536 type:complete len:344 (+) Transcript_13397:701-1732(+)
MTNDLPSLRTALQIASSCLLIYNSSASNTRTATSATFIALKASATAISSRASFFRFVSFLIPAVSTNCTNVSFQYHSMAIASRVRPGVEPAKTRSCSKRALTNELFPTFCRPMTAICRALQSSVVSNNFVFKLQSEFVSINALYFSSFRCSINVATSPKPSPCSADIGIALPKPNRSTSRRFSMTIESSSCAHESPSNLFATTTTFEILPSFRSHRAVVIKSWVTPTLASHNNRTRSLSRAASRVCSIIARPTESLFDFEVRTWIRSPSTPAVSIKVNSVPPILPQHSRRSRVVPGMGETIAPPLEICLLEIRPLILDTLFPPWLPFFRRLLPNLYVLFRSLH